MCAYYILFKRCTGGNFFDFKQPQKVNKKMKFSQQTKPTMTTTEWETKPTIADQKPNERKAEKKKRTTIEVGGICSKNGQ